MTFVEKVKKALTPEMFVQLQDALGDDFDWDVVPRSRLNAVIKQRNELRTQIAGGSPSQTGKGEGHEDDDDDDIDLKGKKGKNNDIDLAELEKKFKDQADQAVKEVKIQYAALDKLRAAGCIAPEMVFSSNAIDKTKLSIDDAGTLTGMDDIITELTKSNAALFKKDVDTGTGKDGGNGDKNVSTKEDFMKLSTQEQIAFKQNNPALFKTFFEQNY